MNTPAWIPRRVAGLLSERKNLQKQAKPIVKQSPVATEKIVETAVPARTTAERLAATLRQTGEALSPRQLRRLHDDLRAIIDPTVSEVEGGRRARTLVDWYTQAPAEQRQDLWRLMSEQFMADPETVRAAQAQYTAAVGTPDEAAAEVLVRRATVSPRRRLLQRFSVNPDGIRFLVDLRAEMQAALKGERRLYALDVEMEYMFSTWFDVGFLELHRISWDSPASLVEKLIRYEAVHDIRSWDDVKNRLDSDRRCYGFFHPRLPGEPLIFVEVAFTPDIADSITPLLDEKGAPADLQRARTAIFYSISNTQPGLKGVSFGDSLIKRVVETLQAELPRLRTFATLSPIPGLRSWLGRQAATLLEWTPPRERDELARALGPEPLTPVSLLAALDRAAAGDSDGAVARWLQRCAAQYLAQARVQGRPADAVARFHLGNGARIERINWAADPSPKGMRQSWGVMVNYLYDLPRLDRNRAALARGKAAASATIAGLCLREISPETTGDKP